MEKITLKELLEQQGMTWYGLYKRGGGSKSMCNDWFRGRHCPNRKSAAKIARAIGLPTKYVLDILKTRDQWDNSPRVAWGTHVREALELTSTNVDIAGRIESGGPWCITCHQRIPKAA